MAALAQIFDSATTADFFYPNDQKAMIDVLVRNLEDVPGYTPSVSRAHTRRLLLSVLLLSFRGSTKRKPVLMIAPVRSRPSGQLRKTFLQVIAGMVTNSADYAKHQHSQDHLIAGLQKIAESVWLAFVELAPMVVLTFDTNSHVALVCRTRWMGRRGRSHAIFA